MTSERAAVEPTLDEERLDATWSAIEGRLGDRQAPASRRRYALGGFALAAAAAILAFVVWPRTATWAGTTLVTATEAVEVRLPEGSEVRAEEASELVRLRESSREVRLSLRAGAATFDVVPNPERLFAVEAGDVEVRVVGTAFRVARVGERVQVEVLRGAVDVRRGDELTRLTAGDRWAGEAAVTEVETAAAQPVPLAAAEEEPPAPESRRGPSADALFTEASHQRRTGAHREAARLYQRLVARYPSDERAPLAAFELGRIRLDLLGDRRGAIGAFRRSLALDGSSPFAQDARARLVEAYDAAGDEAGCRRAREAYLGRHPRGRHVVDVTRACE